MSPSRKKKDEEELENPEVTSDSEAASDTPEADASNTPEADVASEDIEDASPEVPELDADAAEAEADEPLTDEPEPDEDAAPEVAEAPAEAPRRRRRRGAANAQPEPPAPVAQPGRRRRASGEYRPVVRAQAKYVRSSARKARLVCDHIRGKSVEEARAILAVTPRAVARDWSKLLESAVANAEHNHELVGEDLYVKAVHADEGPTIKRFRPRAMGRATKIRKRTAHLTILLTPKN
jgi:ribosomal protein L22